MEFRFESRPLSRTKDDPSTADDGLRPRRIEAGDLEDAIAQYANLANEEVTSRATPRAGNETIVTTQRNGTLYLVRVSHS